LVTLVLDGFRFPADAQMTLRSKTTNASSSGEIVNRFNDTKVSADFKNLACDDYDVFVSSDTANKIAVYNKLDLKPYICK
jgi:hypothetical protein